VGDIRVVGSRRGLRSRKEHRRDLRATCPMPVKNQLPLRSTFVNRADEISSTERGIWSISEESRKFWDYCAYCEAVYIGESLTRDSDVTSPVPELYLGRNLWPEIEVFFVAERNAYLNCILEILDQHSVINRNEDGEAGGCERNDLMLVEIAKKIQLPKKMILRRTKSVKAEAVRFPWQQH